MRALAINVRIRIGLAACLALTPSLTAQIIKTVHPGFDLSQIRPDNFEPAVGGMDIRPDGKMVITTWQANAGTETSSLYLLDGIDGPDRNQIKVKKIAGTTLGGPFNEPLGIVFLDKAYYLVEHSKFWKLEDTSGDDVIDRRTLIYSWPISWWDFGPIYMDGSFYMTTAVELTPKDATWLANQPSPERGACIKMGLDGSHEVVADGLRIVNGLGLGPRGELFVTDNQGSWVPASKLLHIRPGRFFGSPITTPIPAFGDKPISPPAVWLPYSEIGRSTSQPTLMTAGPYKDQMVMGDVALGGLSRVFLEEVNGEFQGAVFPFTGGLEAGINRIVPGKDGSLYLGGIGNGDANNWGWLGKRFGLQKLKPNGKPVFEMLAIRSRAGGMEIEFTLPLPENYNASSFEVWQFWYPLTEKYQNPKADLTKRTITSMRLSPDRKSLYLEIAGLQEKWVTDIRLKGIKSETGLDPLFTQAWYTLNAISNTAPFSKPAAILSETRNQGSWTVRSESNRTLRFAGLSGSNRISVRDARGSLITKLDLEGKDDVVLSATYVGPGLVWITVDGPQHSWTRSAILW